MPRPTFFVVIPPKTKTIHGEEYDNLDYDSHSKGMFVATPGIGSMVIDVVEVCKESGEYRLYSQLSGDYLQPVGTCNWGDQYENGEEFRLGQDLVARATGDVIADPIEPEVYHDPLRYLVYNADLLSDNQEIL